MATIKLSERLRGMIQKHIVNDSAQKAAVSAVREARQEHNKTFYEAWYTKEERELLAFLPRNWVKNNQYAEIFLENDHDWDKCDFGEEKPLDYNGGNRFSVPKDHPFSIRYYQLKRKLEEAETELGVLELKVKGVLSNFTTVAALQKGWSEIEPYIQAALTANGMDGGKVYLPAIPVAELNDILKLPKQGEQQ